MGPRYHIKNAELKKVGFLNAKDSVTQIGMNIAHSMYHGKCQVLFHKDQICAFK